MLFLCSQADPFGNQQLTQLSLLGNSHLSGKPYFRVDAAGQMHFVVHAAGEIDGVGKVGCAADDEPSLRCRAGKQERNAALAAPLRMNTETRCRMCRERQTRCRWSDKAGEVSDSLGVVIDRLQDGGADTCDRPWLDQTGCGGARLRRR